MGRKPKVRTFSFPNYVKNSDQILYRILFIAKSIYLSWLRFVTPAAMIAQTKTTAEMTTARAIGIQSGAVTHHQDQVMTSVSLRTRNTRNKRLRKLVPPTVTVDFALLICWMPFFMGYYTRFWRKC